MVYSLSMETIIRPNCKPVRLTLELFGKEYHTETDTEREALQHAEKLRELINTWTGLLIADANPRITVSELGQYGGWEFITNV